MAGMTRPGDAGFCAEISMFTSIFQAVDRPCRVEPVHSSGRLAEKTNTCRIDDSERNESAASPHPPAPTGKFKSLSLSPVLTTKDRGVRGRRVELSIDNRH